MELPFNTVYSKDILGSVIETPVADWATNAPGSTTPSTLRRRRLQRFQAYTMVKNPDRVNFSYRDNLWQGSDLLATGIASFGHVSGVHYQNQPEWEQYCSTLEAGELPLARGLEMSDHQRLVRELILQLKKGYLNPGYFRDKFGVDILDQWPEVWAEYEQDELCTIDRTADRIQLTGRGTSSGRQPVTRVLRAAISGRAIHVKRRTFSPRQD